MENLIFSLNATVPVFLVIVVGYFLKRIGWINEPFIKVVNKIVFNIALPALLIQDLMNIDFVKEFELKYVLYCAIVTIVSFFGIWMMAKLMIKDKAIVGEFVQAAYRSSSAVLGTAFVLNMYGNTGMVPLMIIGSVPLYNIFAVLVLTVESPDKKGIAGNTVGVTIKGILTNPMLISIGFGVLLSIFKVDFPQMVDNTIGNFAKLASPLALIAIGGSFDFGKAMEKAKPALVASLIKVVGMPILFLPLAIWLGFRDEKLLAVVIMLASPTTTSSFIMARSMKHEGTVTSSSIVLTTIFSSFVLTAIIYILRSLGLL